MKNQNVYLKGLVLAAFLATGAVQAAEVCPSSSRVTNSAAKIDFTATSLKAVASSMNQSKLVCQQNGSGAKVTVNGFSISNVLKAKGLPNVFVPSSGRVPVGKSIGSLKVVTVNGLPVLRAVILDGSNGSPITSSGAGFLQTSRDVATCPAATVTPQGSNGWTGGSTTAAVSASIETAAVSGGKSDRNFICKYTFPITLSKTRGRDTYTKVDGARFLTSLDTGGQLVSTPRTVQTAPQTSSSAIACLFPGANGKPTQACIDAKALEKARADAAAAKAAADKAAAAAKAAADAAVKNATQPPKAPAAPAANSCSTAKSKDCCINGVCCWYDASGKKGSNCWSG